MHWRPPGDCRGPPPARRLAHFFFSSLDIFKGPFRPFRARTMRGGRCSPLAALATLVVHALGGPGSANAPLHTDSSHFDPARTEYAKLGILIDARPYKNTSWINQNIQHTIRLLNQGSKTLNGEYAALAQIRIEPVIKFVPFTTSKVAIEWAGTLARSPDDNGLGAHAPTHKTLCRWTAQAVLMSLFRVARVHRGRRHRQL